MTQGAFFFFNVKDFEFDFWKKPGESSEDVIETYILFFKHVPILRKPYSSPSYSTDYNITGN